MLDPMHPHIEYTSTALVTSNAELDGKATAGSARPSGMLELLQQGYRRQIQ
jgi:hypothetical protein